MEAYDFVFKAIKNGKLSTVKTFFNQKPEDVPLLLSIRTVDGTTPLLMACLHGHVDIVLYLLEKCRAKIEQIGTVSIGGRIEDLTPLGCAVTAKKIDVVEALLTKKARVNGRCENGRTPLHIACSKESLEIAKLLVANGANMEMLDKYDETCLMCSCDVRNNELVEFLLEQGCNVNQKNSCGRTALHHAASSDCLDVFQTLLKYGAAFELDSHGLSPLMVAASSGCYSIVQYFVDNETSCSDTDKVYALELLGATYLGQSESRMTMAYNCLHSAMVLKINKDLQSQETYKIPSAISVILNTPEVSSLSELEMISGNYEKLNVQSLLIRERTLGAGHRNCAFYVISFCDKMADSDTAARLLLYVVESQQKVLKPLHDDTRYALSELVRVFSSMEKEELQSSSQNLILGFQKAVQEMQAAIAAPNAKSYVTCSILFTDVLQTTLQLIELLCEIQPHLDEIKDSNLKGILRPFMEMQILTTNDQTPLHLVCYRRTSPKVVLALLEVGANPNAVDKYGNTPLHAAAMNGSCPEEALEHLLKHGAHVDYYNQARKTPLQLLASVSLTYLQPHDYLNLQCLCAQVIESNKICYSNMVPKEIEKFIQAHCK